MHSEAVRESRQICFDTKKSLETFHRRMGPLLRLQNLWSKSHHLHRQHFVLDRPRKADLNFDRSWSTLPCTTPEDSKASALASTIWLDPLRDTVPRTKNSHNVIHTQRRYGTLRHIPVRPSPPCAQPWTTPLSYWRPTNLDPRAHPDRQPPGRWRATRGL